MNRFINKGKKCIHNVRRSLITKIYLYINIYYWKNFKAILILQPSSYSAINFPLEKVTVSGPSKNGIVAVAF